MFERSSNLNVINCLTNTDTERQLSGQSANIMTSSRMSGNASVRESQAASAESDGELSDKT